MTAYSGTIGNDIITLPADFTALDQVDGDIGFDTVMLTGDHTAFNAIVFLSTTMLNVESMICAGGFGYDLTTDDATVAAGKTLTVDDTAGVLGTGGLTFDGSAETDGKFVLLGGGDVDRLMGGAQNDTIKGAGALDALAGLAGIDTIEGGSVGDLMMGGMGADRMRGGAGHDTFVYRGADESSSTSYDKVFGANFAGIDSFSLPTAVTAVNATIGTGTLSKGSFDSDLSAAVTDATLGGGHAVLFTPNAGDLAGKTFMIVDANGHPGYQAGQDYVIQLIGAHNLDQLDFSDFS